MTQPATAEGLLAWVPGHGLISGLAADTQLLAADSWLVRDGRVRGLDRHRERFLRACGDCGGPSLQQLTDFWRDMTAALPRTGSWFPRVELVAGSLQLRLLLRHAPPPGPDAPGVRVWAAGQPDPRTVPRRKGPDLDVLARVRQRAAGQGAQEAVLIAPSGAVLEAATASLLWWEDDTLCLPSPHLPVLGGVTTGLVQEHAVRSGIEPAHRERTLEQLAGREVWLVNALHGIRPVTGWEGRPMEAGAAPRARGWQEWLDGLGEPLPSPAL
ncbi:branched-subunit amino acid aminotransferase/4-amino-4-deoxychorismate lyase [Streptomyces sp. V3I8]|uniref:aminotransferase class IV n=1 Tax=Streptomyces sp. V3I8 TaxID=3042279 RepID=UPI00278B9399|nr:aminotransferase class IV [Streptomyces sp. V3I8]MDQ1040953.1 branched-subunit amino acid aminotransferase/4-amino-4-deoxychorismate lyase [Streptomyces sp. V3I8]